MNVVSIGTAGVNLNIDLILLGWVKYYTKGFVGP